jgi:hypothetical protein
VSTYIGPDLPLLTSDIVAWLAAGMPQEHFYQGPELPKDPGRMVVISPSQGGGLSMEFMFDQPSFQVHVVGPQSRDQRVNSSAAEAERLTYTVDRFILMAQYPASIAGHHVTHAQRFGSGPSPLPTDAAGRAHFTCTYLLQAESGYAR